MVDPYLRPLILGHLLPLVALVEEHLVAVEEVGCLSLEMEVVASLPLVVVQT